MDDCKPLMPGMLETLAQWVNEPSPVKESVQRTFSEFKKTHQAGGSFRTTT